MQQQEIIIHSCSCDRTAGILSHLYFKGDGEAAHVVHHSQTRAHQSSHPQGGQHRFMFLEGQKTEATAARSKVRRRGNATTSRQGLSYFCRIATWVCLLCFVNIFQKNVCLGTLSKQHSRSPPNDLSTCSEALPYACFCRQLLYRAIVTGAAETGKCC